MFVILESRAVTQPFLISLKMFGHGASPLYKESPKRYLHVL